VHSSSEIDSASSLSALQSQPSINDKQKQLRRTASLQTMGVLRTKELS